MEPKKNISYDLRKKRTLFTNIGLVIALLLVISAFEWKHYNVTGIINGSSPIIEFDPLVNIPNTVIKPPPKPKLLVKIIEIESDIIDSDDLPNMDTEFLEDAISTTIDIDTSAEIMEEHTPEIVDIAEQQPEFPGGYGAFYAYVKKNLKYPRFARKQSVEGKVYIQFIVDTNGALTDVKVIRGIGFGCDAEAVRVVRNSKHWKPGKQRYKPVKVRMVIPIHFKLQ